MINTSVVIWQYESTVHARAEQLTKWKSEALQQPYTHIHGTKDEVLPMRFTQPTHIIPKAGHLMVMSRAVEINAILKEVLVN